MNRLLHTLRLMGPGLLFAGAAIGVSHLVQSTRAGASFGWELAWVVVAVNLFKYPFFEFGSRYALATGESLLQGYRKQGKWVLWFFFLITLLTVFTVQATVTIVTAGIAQNLLPIGEGPLSWSVLVLSTCALILVLGSYSLLDKTMKGIVVILSLSTVIALVGAWVKQGGITHIDTPHFDWGNKGHIIFLIAFMGWMPAPIEISAISSLWLKAKQRHSHVSRAQGLFDFNLGYWLTAALALVFLSLGALVQYGSEQPIALAGSAFAQQLMQMYASTIGDWSKLLVALVAFLCMFGTTLTDDDITSNSRLTSSVTMESAISPTAE